MNIKCEHGWEYPFCKDCHVLNKNWQTGRLQPMGGCQVPLSEDLQTPYGKSLEKIKELEIENKRLHGRILHLREIIKNLIDEL